MCRAGSQGPALKSPRGRVASCQDSWVHKGGCLGALPLYRLALKWGLG